MTIESLEAERKNEQGVVSLAFAGLLAIIMASVIGQVILNQQTLNTVHSNTRNQIIIQQRLRALALEFEEASKQAEVSLGCPTGTTRRTISGGDFCLPAGTNHCTTLTRVINGNEIIENICTSLRATDLAWNDALSGNEVLAVDPASPIVTGVRNIIDVPALADPLWQTCAAATCLRVLLCPDNTPTCNQATATAYQVVRF